MGRVAFATTADYRLMRIDVGTGDSSELVPATPYVSGVAEDVSRGSLSGVVGSGFATQSQQVTAPYPLTLNGVELQIQGAPIPLGSVAPDSTQAWFTEPVTIYPAPSIKAAMAASGVPIPPAAPIRTDCG